MYSKVIPTPRLGCYFCCKGHDTSECPVNRQRKNVHKTPNPNILTTSSHHELTEIAQNIGSIATGIVDTLLNPKKRILSDDSTTEFDTKKPREEEFTHINTEESPNQTAL